MSIKQFYSSTFAPNPLRINFMLKLKAVELNFIDIDISKGEQNTPEFRVISPDGTIPALVLDEGTVFTDTIAIITNSTVSNLRTGSII